MSKKTIPLLFDHRLRQALRVSTRDGSSFALRTLRAEFGTFGAIRLLLEVGLDACRGEPFGKLGPPVDRRDRLSREQAGLAILIWRRLKTRVSEERATALVRAMVIAGGVPFLETMVGELSMRDLEEEPLSHRVRRFFNAEGSVEERGAEVRFQVDRCRFVELLHATEAAPILPGFCEVDTVYFDRPDVPIALIRDRTLAKRDAYCDFRFSEKKHASPGK